MKETTRWARASRYFAVAALTLAAAAPAQVIVYNNTTTFSGAGYAHDGSGKVGTDTVTTLVADDITVLSGFGGRPVTGMIFTTANFNGAAVSASPLVRFYAADGADGGPGTFLGGVNFNPISFNAGQVELFAYNPGTPIFTIPANEQFWAGTAFDDNNGTTGATLAQMNNLGQGVYDPPTVGSSEDVFFKTSTFGDFASSNPVGGFFFFDGNPVANFGWQFTTTPVPEPTTTLGFAALALTVGAWIRRRRLNSTW